MRARIFALLRESGEVYLAQLVGVVVSFGVSVMVARTLGADGRGAYGWIMALVFAAIQIGQLGIDTLNRRMVARELHLAPALAGNSVAAAATWASFAALLVFAAGWWQPVGRAYPFALAVAMATVPVAVLLGTLNALAAGAGRTRVLAMTEIIQRLSLALLVGLALLAVKAGLLAGLEVWHLMVAFLFAAGGATFYAVSRIHGLVGGKWALRHGLYWGEWRLILSGFGAGLCFQLLQRVDVLFLGIWRPLAEVGHYGIAQTLVDVMLMLPVALGFMLMPKLAAERDVAVRTRLLLVILAAVVGSFAAVALVAALLAPWVIPFVFGAQFEPAVGVFQRLCVAAVLMAGFQVCQNAVAGYGRARHVIVAPAVGLAAKVVFGLLLIPSGMLAAANATILAYALAGMVAFALAMPPATARRSWLRR